MATRGFKLFATVLEVGEALVNLPPGELRKGAHHVIHRAAGAGHGRHVMHADPGALDNGLPRAHSGPAHDVAVARRNHAATLASVAGPRNRAGTPAYVKHFSNQLRELLTNHGEITEVWFDGARPGAVKPVYDFLAWRDLVRQFQPKAVIFGQSADVRWVGNEFGGGRSAEWSVFPTPVPPEQFAGGDFMESDLGSRRKIRDAAHLIWWPAEAPVSIRPEWFYHGSENDRVKTTDQLLELYLRHVGGNAFLMLNVPANRQGRLPAADVARLTELGTRLRDLFAADLARSARVTASSTRAGLPGVSPQGVLDDRPDTYWIPEDHDLHPEVVVEFPAPVTFPPVDLGEHLPTGQRIEQFALDADTDDGWRQVHQG